MGDIGAGAFRELHASSLFPSCRWCVFLYVFLALGSSDRGGSCSVYAYDPDLYENVSIRRLRRCLFFEFSVG